MEVALTKEDDDQDKEVLEAIQALEATPLQVSTEIEKIPDSELSVTGSRPKPELKVLPQHLKYAFLEENDESYPVIISSSLTSEQEKKLLKILREHKSAIGWTLADIKGISPDRRGVAQ